ncbi:hypothetical protein [Streptomyces rubradiris]|uniref:LysR substrate-binding domain-containing protein n=1 Tax=Streptomyces rubradiris TaxID=285531 RepID=A0ABQ3RBH0_STRRR|nr:hypothetical protein [Streptomyces rubradiris]GHH27893.1 hypothetical protein GCM10018792_70850 [Streptomyces rubradiris]GHI53198.1 hypothetical protein Srubr_30440 [Streptomyces rubradiris]
MLAAERAAAETMDVVRGEQQSTVRIGTSVGLGPRLDGALTALSEQAPWLLVELVSGPTTTRMRQVRDGYLHATFVRGADRAPGLELLSQAAVQPVHRIAFRPFADRARVPSLPTYLATRPDPPSRRLTALLQACNQQAEQTDTGSRRRTSRTAAVAPAPWKRSASRTSSGLSSSCSSRVPEPSAGLCD